MMQLSKIKTILSDLCNKDSMCAICRKKLNRRKKLREVSILKCEHFFHKHCVLSWLTTKYSKMQCPLCRHHAITGLELKQKDLNPYGQVGRKKSTFTCSKCEATFPSSCNLTDHLQKFGHTDPKRKYGCRSCHHLFQSHDSLQNHLKTANHFSNRINRK